MDISSFFQLVTDSSELFTVQDVVLTIVLSFVLSMIIGYTYRATHHSVVYSQSYVQTLVLMGMVVSIVMLIIGSNIARAFALVGALSIVRFRNAIKETRDVGFIFYAMAIGMACGTRFYLLAVISTGIVSGLIWLMTRTNMFAKDAAPLFLKIRVPGDMPYATLFDAVFERYLNRYELVAVETVQAGTLIEVAYSVELKRGGDAQAFMQAIGELNNQNKVVLITGQQEVDL